MKKVIANLWKIPHEKHIRLRSAAWLARLALLALCIPGRCLAVAVLYEETFDSDPHWGRGGGGEGIMWVTNGVAVLRHVKTTPTDPDDIPGYWTSWATWWKSGTTTTNWTFTLQPGRIVEVRTDAVSFTQDDAFAGLGVGSGKGFFNAYLLMLARNEIILFKGGSGTPDYYSCSYFFWDSISLPARPVTLSMKFTQVESDLQIDIRVFDKATPTIVRYKKTVIDTPGKDDMLPNRSRKGILMEPEGIAAPYVGIPWMPCVGVAYINPDQGPAMPPEVTLDNFQMLEYAVPKLEITNSVCLSWPENTMEEQVVVSADSVPSSKWTLCPEPVFRRGGMLCVAVPITQTEQYFKTVPGFQFSDSFSDTQPPFTNRNSYVNLFPKPEHEVTINNGVLRIGFQGPMEWAAILLANPMYPAAVRDFYTSVDILSWTTSSNQWSNVLLAARGRDFPNAAEGYLAGLHLNQGAGSPTYGVPGDIESVIGRASFDPPVKFTWHGSRFNIRDIPPPYRLEFSGVGSTLTLRVLKLPTQEVIQQVTMTDTVFTQGWCGLYMEMPYNLAESHEATLDNYFVTGKKP
ncbi:MAG TPA: hypothetical protein P5186_12285 [Candidatus Paceibacterota bacterium]|nr:hypothetical protein [Verrucomicrobiota bacterium]HRY48819.1 hypothetical protein [Candidatus Paceibacterota bacterium]HSA02504.1 hypothetical protein [Candidatus Paceibacterota bacterium]